MKYIYEPFDSEYCVVNLRRDQYNANNLTWDSAGRKNVLMIQTPFGKYAEDMMNEICDALEKTTLASIGFTGILPEVWACIIPISEKTEKNICPLNRNSKFNGESATYTVFGICIRNDMCAIYAPRNQGIISARMDIPLLVHVEIDEQYRKGWFGKLIPTGFYTISLPESLRGYVDGSLVLRVGRLEIPVTGEMIERREIFVKSPSEPVVISADAGLKLI